VSDFDDKLIQDLLLKDISNTTDEGYKLNK
jgi:hypothetical protein